MQNIWISWWNVCIQMTMKMECRSHSWVACIIIHPCRYYPLTIDLQPLSIPISCKIATFAQINRPVQIMPDVYFPRLLLLCARILFLLTSSIFIFFPFLLFALFFITIQNLLSRFLSASQIFIHQDGEREQNSLFVTSVFAFFACVPANCKFLVVGCVVFSLRADLWVDDRKKCHIAIFTSHFVDKFRAKT